MRVAYSIIREIHRKNFLPEPNDYGLKEYEFRNFIFLLEQEGFLERVLRANDQYSLKPARLTKKGMALLESNKHYEKNYPDRSSLKKWVQVDKRRNSNGAEEDNI
ncbi:hypothetical protein [Radiobacillus sp. PE A8.2]|uniref:hypothetical protein n=1 Tax=Radiobacillus sp. PE A8.2 TaxID=3380349 RepID=UPI0038908DFA